MILDFQIFRLLDSQIFRFLDFQIFEHGFDFAEKLTTQGANIPIRCLKFSSPQQGTRFQTHIS